MSDEIRVGDRVKHQRWQAEYEVVAIDKGYAWLRTAEAAKGVLAALFNLTRIEPDVPKAKYSVGDWVQRPPEEHGFPGVVVGVHPPSGETYYDVDWSDGRNTPCFNVKESELEPVRICETCGKVRDG